MQLKPEFAESGAFDQGGAGTAPDVRGHTPHNVRGHTRAVSSVGWV
jgi:hypothetical protein